MIHLCFIKAPRGFHSKGVKYYFSSARGVQFWFSLGTGRCYRITELYRSEKTLQIIKPHHHPALTTKSTAKPHP